MFSKISYLSLHPRGDRVTASVYPKELTFFANLNLSDTSSTPFSGASELALKRVQKLTARLRTSGTLPANLLVMYRGLTPTLNTSAELDLGGL